MRLTTAISLMLSMALTSACGGKKDDGGSGNQTAGKAAVKAGGGGGSEKATALKDAWKASQDCQVLESCCAGLAGSSWESTLEPLCEQIKGLQDFETQSKNMVDPSFQSSDCRNRVAALAGMGSGGNPLPDVCLAGAAGSAPKTAPVEAPAAKKDEPWRTTLPVVAADTKCPESWWLVITTSNLPPAELAASINRGYARPTEGGGLAVKFANYDIPVDPEAWSAPSKAGEVTVGFELVAKGGKLIPGTYITGDPNAKLQLVSPGAGYDRGEAGTGGVGFMDKGPSVEILSITDEQICGRVNIDDSYNSVVGPFTIQRLSE